MNLEYAFDGQCLRIKVEQNILMLTLDDVKKNYK